LKNKKLIAFSILVFSFMLVIYPIKSTFAETGSLQHDQLSNNSSIKAIPLTEAEMQKIRDSFYKEQTSGEDASYVINRLKKVTPVSINIDGNKTLRTNTVTFDGAGAGHIYLSDNPPRTEGEGGLDSNGWLDCRTEYISPSATGSGYAWGWLGRYIDVTGSGSANMNISFSGRYEGVLEATNTLNTNTYCKIAAQVCDVTDDNFSIVAENVIVERGFTFLMLPNDVAGTIGSNDSIQATLYADHTYLLRLVLYTSAQTRWYTASIWGLSDFHSGGPDGQGLDYNSVNLTW